MKTSIREKLQTLCDRYEEVGHLLSSADIIADQNRFRSLSKEYSELEDVAHAWSAFEQAEADRAEAELLAQDADPDMRDMGRDIA